MKTPLDLTEPRASTPHELAAAIAIIDRTGLVPAIDEYLNRPTGRPRTFATCYGLLVGLQLNGLRRHHRGHTIEVVRCITSLSSADRARIGLTNWDPHRSHTPVYRFMTALSAMIDEAPTVEIHGRPVRLNRDAFINIVLRAGIPPDAPMSSAIALDGSAIDTWGALYGDAEAAEIPQDDAADARPHHLRSRRQPTTKLVVRGTGPDGRKIYTHDHTARAGHRTATNCRPSGKFIGYELHVATQVRSTVSTNFVDEVTFGEVPPGFILGATIRPAATHRGNSTVGLLQDIRMVFPATSEVLADPGYTLLKPDTFLLPARLAGYDVIFEPTLHQRGTKPSTSGGVMIEGGYFSRHLPPNLRQLPSGEPLVRAPRGAKPEELAKADLPFNQRAAYRYSRHSRPDARGNMRIRCPFCAGRLRSRAFPRTMRLAHTIPLVHIETDASRCCAGIVTVSAQESALWQPIPAFTTAWRRSYGRRSVVEGTFGGLKDQWVQLGQGFHRVLDMGKLNTVTAFTLAGYNHHRARRHGLA